MVTLPVIVGVILVLVIVTRFLIVETIMTGHMTVDILITGITVPITLSPQRQGYLLGPW
jgi:hypothetical protein